MTTMRIHLGTSGFSYEDWRGVYYPADLPKREMLTFYAGRRSAQADLLTPTGVDDAPVFDTVEINATYYRLPPARAFAAMAAKTPPGFTFCVKAPGGVTHPRDYTTPDRALIEAYCAAVTPLAAESKLGPTLLQFPHRFRPDQTGLDYLRAVAAEFAGLDAVVEFRRREWLCEEALSLLRELGLGWVSVDMPSLEGLPPPLLAATTPTVYVRFHGRNARSWWRGDNISRYDYAYTEDELAPWAERLRALEREPITETISALPPLSGDDSDLARMIRLLQGPVERVFLFFNNHPRGKAVQAARALRGMLAR